MTEPRNPWRPTSENGKQAKNPWEGVDTKQAEIDSYEQEGGGMYTGLKKGLLRAKQSIHAGLGLAEEGLLGLTSDQFKQSDAGRWIQESADSNKQAVIDDQHSIDELPTHPTMRRMATKANKEDTLIGGLSAVADQFMESPDKLGFTLDTLAEQAPVIVETAIGTKGAGAIFGTATKAATAATFAGGAAVGSIGTTFGSNVASAMGEDVSKFDDATSYAFTRSLAQGIVDGTVGAFVPFKLGPNQLVNVPTQAILQAVGGGGGEYVAAKSVGETPQMGDVVLEGVLELLSLPTDIAMAKLESTNHQDENKPWFRKPKEDGSKDTAPKGPNSSKVNDSETITGQMMEAPPLEGEFLGKERTFKTDNLLKNEPEIPKYDFPPELPSPEGPAPTQGQRLTDTKLLGQDKPVTVTADEKAQATEATPDENGTFITEVNGRMFAVTAPEAANDSLKKEKGIFVKEKGQWMFPNAKREKIETILNEFRSAPVQKTESDTASGEPNPVASEAVSPQQVGENDWKKAAPTTGFNSEHYGVEITALDGERQNVAKRSDAESRYTSAIHAIQALKDTAEGVDHYDVIAEADKAIEFLTENKQSRPHAPPTQRAINRYVDRISQQLNKPSGPKRDAVTKTDKGEVRVKSLDEIISAADSKNPSFMDFDGVGNGEKLEKDTGISGISGYTHGINSKAVNHIFKEHGNQESEALRGQIAVTADDIKLIPDIVTNYDKAERAGLAGSSGLETIKYTKRYNGTTYYLEEIRTGRKKLFAKTMWKVPTTRVATEQAGDRHTSKTAEGDFPHHKSSVVQSNEQGQRLSSSPESRQHSRKHRQLAERLQQLVDDMPSKLPPDAHSARDNINSAVTELRKPQSTVDVVGLLTTAAERLFRNHGAQYDVVSDVMSDLINAYSGKSSQRDTDLDAIEGAAKEAEDLGAESLSSYIKNNMRVIEAGTDELVSSVREKIDANLDLVRKKHKEALDPSHDGIEQILTDGQKPHVILDWIINNSPNESFREIARKIKPFVSNDIDIVIVNKDKEPRKFFAKSSDSRGLFTYGKDKSKDTLFLRDRSFGMLRGTIEQVALHELIHAALARSVDEQSKAAGNELMLRLTAVHNKALAEYVAQKKNFLGTEASDLREATKDKHEILAWGLTNPEFQKFLHEIKMGTASAWSKFVDSVMRYFGLGNEHKTALSEVLSVFDELTTTPDLVESNTGKKAATAPEHTHNQGKKLDLETKYEPTATGGSKQQDSVDIDEHEIVDLPISLDDFKEITDEWAELFENPQSKTITANRPEAKERLTPEQARARIDEWKAKVAEQFKKHRGENSNRTILSLFDYTGEWSKPYEEAGYNVIRFDIQNGLDVMDFSAEYFNENWDFGEVYGILAATPCTDFAVSGARHFAAKDADGRTEASKELVFQTMRTIEYFRPKFWVLENPVGRIENLTGLPKARMTFDPWQFGHPYTKKTVLWGKFNSDLPLAPVDPTEGSKMHSKYGGKSQATKNARSETPEGFAYAFFLANNEVDSTPLQRLSNDYPEASGAINKALEAGISEDEIREAMYETYENYDYKAARTALAKMVIAKLPKKDGKPDTSKPSNKPEKPRAPVDKVESEQPKEAVSKEFGKDNKIFTAEAAAKAREILRKKLSQMNSGIDPEIMQAGMMLAGHYIEGGLRKFGDFSATMIQDLGEAVRPFLRSFYESVRHYPGFDNSGMSTADEIEAELADGRSTVQTERENQSDEVQSQGDDAQQSLLEPDAQDVEAKQPEDGGRVKKPRGARRSRRSRTVSDAGGGNDADGGRDAADRREGASGTGVDDVRAGGSGDTGRGSGNPVDVEPSHAESSKTGDFHIDDPLKIVGGGQVARFNKNREAIEVFNELRDTGRKATPEEQATLAGYTGWGSFGQELFQGTWKDRKPKDGWEERDAWLRDHLGQKEWEGAQNSIINAHYTDPPTVLAMWKMAERMGFKGGRVLEPSMGIGNFFGMMPLSLKKKSQLSGIELDPLTGGMAKLLYPNSNIAIKGYEESATPDNFYDLVIGNWPFFETGPADRRYMKLSPTLHDYFFLKAVDQVRPGGLVIGITSKGSMDKLGANARLALSRKAELVAAYRLPSGAFQEYAGTKVVTDIIILKKRAEPVTSVDESWMESVPYMTPSGENVNINQYFVDNPSHVIGTIDFGHGTTTMRPGMIVHRPDNVAAELERIVSLTPENVMEHDERKRISYISNNTDDRQLSITKTDKGLFIVHGEHLAPLEEIKKYSTADKKVTANRTAQIEALIDLRKKYAELIDAELRGNTAEQARSALRKAYEAFVKDHGSLNKSWALGYFRAVGDPFFPSLAALERNEGTKSRPKWTPATILSQSTVRIKQSIENPSIADAFVLARTRAVEPTLAEIAAIAKKPEAEVRAALIESGAVYPDHGDDVVPADVYLSGNVRFKLKMAKAAVESGKTEYERNVKALEKVLPKDTPYYEIEPQLGATWVSTDYYRDYLQFLLGLTDEQRDSVEIRFAAGRWKVSYDSGFDHLAKANSGFGMDSVKFKRLINAAISNQVIKVMAKDSDGNEYVHEERTTQANDRIAAIREEFKTWLWKDAERRNNLEASYNDARNAVADPHFDGSFLPFEGMALTLGNGPFNLRQHQANAIWRAIATRKSMNAHEVGTGKTFTLTGIAVESRRYGIAKKPLVLAHNANSASVAHEAQMMYPGAKVLYIDNLSPDTIDVKLRQIANDDWDMVVMPHSLISRLTLTEKTLMEMARDEIAELESEAKDAAQEDNAEIDWKAVDAAVESGDTEALGKEVGKIRSQTAKELVKIRNNIITSIKKQALRSSKDGAIPFEELGIDMILVDECFTYETLVDTDIGMIQIGEIVENNLRVNIKSINSSTHAIEYKPVVNWYKNKRRSQLIEVFHEEGSFTCTPNHKIWVEGFGYRKAASLQPQDKLRIETARLSDQAREHGKYKDVRMVQGRDWLQGAEAEAFLQRFMQDVLSKEQQRIGVEVAVGYGENVVKLSTERDKKRSQLYANERKQSDEEIGNKEESIEEAKRDWSQAASYRGERQAATGSSSEAVINPWAGNRACSFDQENSRLYAKAPKLLQGGSCRPTEKESSGIRRGVTQFSEVQKKGHQKDDSTGVARLVGIAIIEQGGDGEYRFCGRAHTHLYDIEVLDNHNYFANGTLVSNCHEFKKPPIVTKMSMKGLNKGTSDKSLSLRFLTKYVRANNNGGNVHTFSGTMMTNTLSEMYHQMRYIMEEEMAEDMLDSWDGWFGAFASEVQDVELTATGDWEPVTRLAAFVNVAELRRMVGQYMDVVFSDDMPEMQPRKTKTGKTLSDELSREEMNEILNGRTEKAADRPYKKVVNDTAEMTPDQEEQFHILQGYANAWRNFTKKQRKQAMAEGAPESPIITEGMATKAGFDVRISNESLAGMEGQTEDHPNSKASRVVKNVLEIYRSHKLANQVIFMDLGVSKSVERTRRGPGGSKTKYRAKVFSTAHDIIERLVQAGIPREEIELVTGSTSKAKRKEIADKMNTGELRVVLGGTDALGVGVNMQRNLRAMHHLDAPWMPGELEQRNGRGHRQGNQWNTVYEYRYLTERLDGRRWMVLALKQKFINSFMKSDANTRVLEGDAASDSEDSDLLGTLSEAAGDPRILIRAKLDKDIDRWSRRERAHGQGIVEAKQNARAFARYLEEAEKRVDKLSMLLVEANRIREQFAGENFTAEIDGVKFDKRADATEAIKAAVAKHLRKNDTDVTLGTVYGLRLSASNVAFTGDVITLNVKASNGLNMPISTDTLSIASLDSKLRRVGDELASEQEDAERYRKSIQQYNEAAQEPFKGTEKLADLHKKRDELDQDMALNPVPAPGWLRNGAPLDTDVFWHGEKFTVTGHRWTEKNWFVIAEDAKGSRELPYNELKDNQGMPVYDEREFTKPEVKDKDGNAKTKGAADIVARKNKGDAGKSGLTIDEVKAAAFTFFKKFKGGLTGKLRIYATQEEAFGPNSIAEHGIIKGGFDPATGDVYLIAENLTDLSDLMATLQHEVIVHKGLGLLSPEEIRKFLSEVARAGKLDPKVKAVMDDILTHYGNEDETYLAEEVVARLAERGMGMLDRAWVVLRAAFTRLFRALGLKNDVMTKAEIVEQIYKLGDSLRERKANPRSVSGGKMMYRKMNASRSLQEVLDRQAGGTWAKVAEAIGKSGFDAVVEGAKRSWLGAITLRQLGDLAKQLLPQINHYVEVVHKMLTDRNVLAERAAEIVEGWQKWAVKNREMSDKLSDLMHESTLAGVDPSEDFESMEVMLKERIRTLKNLIKGRSGQNTNHFMEELRELSQLLTDEPRRKKKWAELRPLWDALSPEAQGFYRQVRDEYKTRHEFFKAILVKRIENAEILESTKKEMLARLRFQFETQEKSGPYFPLARFGQYFVETADRNGQRVFMMFESEREQKQAIKNLESEGFIIHKQGHVLDKDMQQDGASFGFISDLIDQVEGTTLNDQKKSEIADSIYQLYLQSLPSRSMRKSFIHRKGVAGYSVNAIRAFADNMMKGSYQLARLSHIDEMNFLMKDMERTAQTGGNKRARLYNEMLKRHEWVKNPQNSALSQKITGMGFIWMLGVSPAAAAVNITQTPVIALPVLGARFGFTAAARALLSAARGFSFIKGEMKPKTLSQVERDAIQEWKDMGLLDATRAHDLAGLAENGGYRYSGTQEKWMRRISFLFHRAEQFNREATALAAFRLAMKNGSNYQQAVKIASELTWDSHYEYSNTNRARFMQGDFMKVATQFKQYSQNTTWYLLRNFERGFLAKDKTTAAERQVARRQLFGTLGMTAVIGGLNALPLWTLYALANAGLGDDDEPFDAQTEFYVYLSEAFGKDAADAIIYGAGGAGISNRVTLDGMWVRDPNRDLEGQDLWTFYAQQAAGPVMGGILPSMIEGVRKIGQGEYTRGVENMVPKFVKDPIKALRYMDEGATTMKGDELKPKDDFTVWQIVLQAIGISDAAVQKQYAENSAIKGYEQHILDRRKLLMLRFYMARKEGDPVAVADITAKIHRFNQKNPRIAINGKALSQSMKARARAHAMDVSGLSLNKRLRYLAEDLDYAN